MSTDARAATRALVTGATGFLGRHALEPLLRRGFEVHGLTSRDPPRDTSPGVRWHRADLLTSDGASSAIRATRPDVLLHFAWYVEHGHFWTSSENLRWVEASSRLLRAFIEEGGSRAVFAGTCAEYDWSAASSCIDESHPVRPRTLYGAAKHAVHVLAESYARQAGFAFAWGRIFFPVGPGEDARRLVPSVTRNLLAGRPARVSSGTQVRDFLAATDVADAFAALADSEISGAVNIGSGKPMTVRELILRVGEAVGRAELIDFGALPDRPGDPPELVAAVGRLRDELGWSPQGSVEAAVRAAVDGWRRAS